LADEKTLYFVAQQVGDEETLDFHGRKQLADEKTLCFHGGTSWLMKRRCIFTAEHRPMKRRCIFVAQQVGR